MSYICYYQNRRKGIVPNWSEEKLFLWKPKLEQWGSWELRSLASKEYPCSLLDPFFSLLRVPLFFLFSFFFFFSPCFFLLLGIYLLRGICDLLCTFCFFGIVVVGLDPVRWIWHEQCESLFLVCDSFLWLYFLHLLLLGFCWLCYCQGILSCWKLSYIWDSWIDELLFRSMDWK